MRKALEFPRIDEGKLDAVEALIAAIADKEPGTAGEELEDLAALTGKVSHTGVCYFQRAKRRKKGLFFVQKGRNTEQSPQLFAHL